MYHFMSYKTKLQQQKQQLLQQYPIKSIGFFGSVVRDDFTDASDIDMIVEFTRPVGMEFIELADRLEAILESRVDLVSRKGLRESSFEGIKNEIRYV